VFDRRAFGRMLFLPLALAAAPASADDSLFERFGKAAGLIAPPTDPPDFVKDSRPSGEPETIPVFAAPAEPSSKVKSPAELKAMDAELEGASRRGEGAAGPRRKAARAAKHDAKP
jgi:hypothetical protein